MLSRSDTFEYFNSSSDGIILDENGNNLVLKELALMNKSGDKCWARIAFAENTLLLNKNRIYDILWNINLVSIKTQLKQINN